jgi:hypothetical protein
LKTGQIKEWIKRMAKSNEWQKSTADGQGTTMLAEMKVKGKESVWGRSTKKRDTACASLETDPGRLLRRPRPWVKVLAWKSDRSGMICTQFRYSQSANPWLWTEQTLSGYGVANLRTNPIIAHNCLTQTGTMRGALDPQRLCPWANPTSEKPHGSTR